MRFTDEPAIFVPFCINNKLTMFYLIHFQQLDVTAHLISTAIGYIKSKWI